MREIELDLTGDWDVVVEKKSKESKEIYERKIPKTKVLEEGGIYLPASIISSMEILAQGVFRPNEEDIEVVYALSGMDALPDMVHQFSTEMVVSESSPVGMGTFVPNMLKCIASERGSSPELLVQIHTHPGGSPKPSDLDLRFFRSTATMAKGYFPGVRVVFGIHAVTGGTPRERRKPQVKGNLVSWKSITHDHGVGFYDENGKRVNVVIT